MIGIKVIQELVPEVGMYTDEHSVVFPLSMLFLIVFVLIVFLVMIMGVTVSLLLRVWLVTTMTICR
jgi:hypothetical protein